MKIILVPTDFSKSALNAVMYAAEVAKDMNSQLVLLHVHDTTAVTINPQAISPLLKNLEKKALGRLLELKDTIEQRFEEGLVLHVVVRSGGIVDEIEDSAAKHQADMLVMGIQGTNYIVERFVGSTTTSLMHHSTHPVMCVDLDVKYQPIRRIVLAIDGNTVDYANVLKPLKEIIQRYNANLDVLHVAPALVTAEADEKTGFSEIEPQLSGIPHRFHFHSQNEVEADINEFVRKNNIDMVVMMPRKHSVLDGIFKEADTKRMAFHSSVPLLTLPA